MTEAELQSGVIDCARLFGWRVAHFRPALTKHGWRTPVQADGAGFPDLVLVRGTELLIVELKADRGKLSDEQHGWLDAFDHFAHAVGQAVDDSTLRDYQFDEAPRVEVHVWRPDDWTSGSIDKALARARTEVAA